MSQERRGAAPAHDHRELFAICREELARSPAKLPHRLLCQRLDKVALTLPPEELALFFELYGHDLTQRFAARYHPLQCVAIDLDPEDFEARHGPIHLYTAETLEVTCECVSVCEVRETLLERFASYQHKAYSGLRLGQLYGEPLDEVFREFAALLHRPPLHLALHFYDSVYLQKDQGDELFARHLKCAFELWGGTLRSLDLALQSETFSPDGSHVLLKLLAEYLPNMVRLEELTLGEVRWEREQWAVFLNALPPSLSALSLRLGASEPALVARIVTHPNVARLERFRPGLYAQNEASRALVRDTLSHVPTLDLLTVPDHWQGYIPWESPELDLSRELIERLARPEVVLSRRARTARLFKEMQLDEAKLSALMLEPDPESGERVPILYESLRVLRLDGLSAQSWSLLLRHGPTCFPRLEVVEVGLEEEDGSWEVHSPFKHVRELKLRGAQAGWVQRCCAVTTRLFPSLKTLAYEAPTFNELSLLEQRQEARAVCTLTFVEAVGSAALFEALDEVRFRIDHHFRELSVGMQRRWLALVRDLAIPLTLRRELLAQFFARGDAWALGYVERLVSDALLEPLPRAQQLERLSLYFPEDLREQLLFLSE